MNKVAVYMRVSTDHQETAMQEHAIEQWLTVRGITADFKFVDQGISGKTTARPEFQRLCQAVAAGDVDTVVVYRLDRLSRNAKDVLELLIDWMRRDVEFFAVDQPILSLGRDNPFKLTILSIFSELAEVERETIVRRIKAGLRAARARGVRPGPKTKLTEEQLRQAVQLRAQGLTFDEIAIRMNISRTMAFRAAKRGSKLGS